MLDLDFGERGLNKKDSLLSIQLCEWNGERESITDLRIIGFGEEMSHHVKNRDNDVE
jgi:hypothetical protein